MHYIEMVQLLNFSNSYIRQILAGMKRCAAIGHALVMNPKVLLTDEPFSALDIQIHQDRTIWFLAHKINDAMALGGVIVVLSPKLAGINRDRCRFATTTRSSYRGFKCNGGYRRIQGIIF
jgi:NitT/TauT family transport system ATP-binding protein